MNKHTSLYRPNVGIMVVNEAGKVLICQRTDVASSSWQMPQGGIDKDEDVKAAALRELYEETNISSSDIEVIDLWNEYQYYDLPLENIGCYSEMIGQKQKWLVVKYLNEENSIDLSKATDKEFNDYKWVNIKEAVDLIWKPKRAIYRRLAAKYSDILA